MAPLNWVLSPNPDVLQLPPSVVGGIGAGLLQLRVRLELLADRRTLRARLTIANANDPMPAPQSPDINSPNVGGGFDLTIEKVTWFEWRSSYTMTNRQSYPFKVRQYRH